MMSGIRKEFGYRTHKGTSFNSNGCFVSGFHIILYSNMFSWLVVPGTSAILGQATKGKNDSKGKMCKIRIDKR